MIAHLRGALGTQVLSLMGWYAHAIDRGEEITKVVHYIRGVHKFSEVEYVSQIFENVPKVEVTKEGFNKFRFNRQNLQCLLTYRSQVLDLLQPKDVETPVEEEIVHVRTGDRHPTGLPTYNRYLLQTAAESPRIIGSHPRTLKVLAKATGARYEPADAISDWHLVRNAETVVGGFSTFTLSALAVNPELQLFLLPQDGPIPALTTHGEWNLMRWLVRQCPNLKWMEMER